MTATDDGSDGGGASFSFVVLEKLGAGASSDVYRAREERSALQVALKVGHHDDAASSFAREAEVLAAVDSLHLPELIDVGRVAAGSSAFAGRPYLAMTLFEGSTLAPTAALSLDERHALALVVARDIGQALADLDAAGMAHGDVKPANIRLLGSRCVDASQRVIDAQGGGLPAWAALVDLGLAACADSALPVGGTARYLAPEMWSGGHPGDARARDSYALGLLLAEIVEPGLAVADDLVSALQRAQLAAPFGAWCRALTAREPGARPRAWWIAEQARGQRSPPRHAADPRRASAAMVRSAYLGSRRAEISHAAGAGAVEVRVPGDAGAWLERAIRLTRRARRLGGEPTVHESIIVDQGDELARARWLVSLVGGAAARWPIVHGSDSIVAEALCDLAMATAPHAWTFAQLEDAVRRRAAAGLGDRGCPPAPPCSPFPPLYAGGRRGSPAPLDPAGAKAPSERATIVAGARPEEATSISSVDLALALALGGERRRAAIAAIERRPSCEAPLRRAAADALRRAGQAGRALALLEGDDDDVAHAVRAEVARRAGDPARAACEARAAVACGSGTASALAVLARLAIDAGDARGALTLLADAAPSFATAEARALACMALGDGTNAAHEIARAEALAETEEARGRAAGLIGYVAHQSGDIARAASAFLRASEHADRADATVEEATYLTGAAAAHVDEGHLDAALEASRRASLLWEHLARPHEAARALLARAASFSLAGAVHEATSTAQEARERARLLGDVRAQAFACWAITDVEPVAAPAAVTAARTAMRLLEHAGDPNDRLRACARIWRHAPGELSAAALLWSDDTAASDNALAGARLDWWRARCERWPELATRDRERAVRQVCQLAARTSAIGARGPACAAAAALAKQLGDGDASRLLTRVQADAARTLIARTPPGLAATVRTLPWVESAGALVQDGVSSEQIAEFETLVRALGARDRLRPLLEQILDSLILWTGVERGLLLLVANGKLVPRAARNLAREDLEGEQRRLSHSLAQRAMALGETVVAVDATGEMPSVHASVHALKLRSVLAIPLIARGQSLGVVYLDDRVRRGAFGPRELAWVKLVATLAALAVADARDQIVLRRTARRAERAKQALADELARREAELDVASRELERRSELGTRYRYDAIIGKSAAVQTLLRILDRVTTSEVPVLVTGESGSGKELVARAVHANGRRRGQPFVSENCAAVPETLLESTLFGHVRGAFTGADRARAGWFEIAHGGTLFLDEIGEMSLHMQTRLLRVLEDGEVQPLGSERGRKVDVRVIAATHRDLAAMVKAGTFREDLFYRLHVIAVRVPPLRERKDDIPLLVHHFLDKHAPTRKPRVTADAMNHLRRFDWPGNVRQLENEVRRAIVLSDEVIETANLSFDLQRGPDARPMASGLRIRPRIDALETDLVQAALAQTRGNQTKAAELLGLSRFGLQKMMVRLGIKPL